MCACCASSASLASVVAPTSRLGDCTARRNAASSSGLAIRRNHDSASFTSPRSRNAVPPLRWYGTRSSCSAFSSARLWWLPRNRMQKSLHGACLAAARKWISAATFSASCAPSRHSHTRMRSPSAWSLHSVLGCSCGLLRDERVGGAQHAVGAAVVLLQLDDLQRRIILAQVEQVVRVGAAPGVDGLVVVAHAGEQALVAGQRLQQPVLRVVGVLALVHQQVADALAPCQAQRFVGFQHLHGQTDQVVEIDGIESRQARLVALVHQRRFHLARAVRRGQRLVRRKARVLRARDQVAHVVDRVGLAARRHQVLDLRGAVVAVEYREAAPQAGLGVVDLQKLQPQRVERADRQSFGRVAPDALGDALLHFLRRLVGEGDGGDALGRHAAGRDQVRDLLDDHARLAAAGAGKHEQGPFGVQDGGALGRIETVHCVCLLPRTRRRIVP